MILFFFAVALWLRTPFEPSAGSAPFFSWLSFGPDFLFQLDFSFPARLGPQLLFWPPARFLTSALRPPPPPVLRVALPAVALKGQVFLCSAPYPLFFFPPQPLFRYLFPGYSFS